MAGIEITMVESEKETEEINKTVAYKTEEIKNKCFFYLICFLFYPLRETPPVAFTVRKLSRRQM